MARASSISRKVRGTADPSASLGMTKERATVALRVVAGPRICGRYSYLGQYPMPDETRPYPLASREPVTFSIFSCFLHIKPAVFQALSSPQQSRHPERSASQIYRK